MGKSEPFQCISPFLSGSLKVLKSKQYLGPTATQMAFLFVFIVINSMTLFAVGVLLIRNIWVIGANVTTIESWEIERHASLVKRARKQGGYVYGPNGTQVMLSHQEFPYDIGILENITQYMGSSPFLWLIPLESTPSNDSGMSFITNGFDGTKLTC